MELQIYQVDGRETGRTVVLDASVFGIEPNDHVLWLDVRRTQANRRQGTHKTKERGEIAGSTRKLYRQKGTGLARSGTIKSPLRRSGGRVFGPRPRDYGLKLNKKTRRLARRSALSHKARADAIRVVERMAFEAPNTTRLVGMIEALGLEGQKVLLLTAQSDAALYRSSRNLPKIRVREARNASTEELLGAGVVVLEEGALRVLIEALAEVPSAEAAPVEEKARAAAPPVVVEEAVDEPAADVEAEEPAADVEAEEPAADVEAEEPAADVEAEEPAADVEAEEPADEAAIDEAETDVEAEEPADEAAIDEAATDEAATDEAATDEAATEKDPQ